jgi:uncharacterized protein (DUF302 family)
MTYGLSKDLPMSFDQAIERVTEELKKEGFGVLTTIDVKETLKKKINVDFPRYTILGACNPTFAHKALQAEENVGLLLPCNVVVQEKGSGTAVSVFDPMVMTHIVENPVIRSVATEVKAKLERVLEAITENEEILQHH